MRWNNLLQVLSKKPIGKRCDVYSYGIVVWELLTHKFPFEQINEFQIYDHVVTDRKVGCQKPLSTISSDTILELR